MFIQLKSGAVINADNVDTVYIDEYDEKLRVATLNDRINYEDVDEYTMEDIVELIERNSSPCTIPEFISVKERAGRLYINPSCVGRITTNGDIKGSEMRYFYSRDKNDSTRISKSYYIQKLNKALQNVTHLQHTKFIKVNQWDFYGYKTRERYLNIAHIAHFETNSRKDKFANIISLRCSTNNERDFEERWYYIKENAQEILTKIKNAMWSVRM